LEIELQLLTYAMYICNVMKYYVGVFEK
jgi:hypothetical protein